MRVLPTYSNIAGTLHVQGHMAWIKNPEGEISWAYSSKDSRINIVGCPRSGTLYTTRVLSKLGYNIGHEVGGIDGSVGYHLAVIKPKNCLHQVRHPLKQIASMITHGNWGFSNQIVKPPNMRLLGCMTLWLKLNELCEEFTVWRYQLEELPEIWDEFCERIGHEKCKLPDVPKTTNANKRTKPITWADLFIEDEDLAQKIFDKAVQYDYHPAGQMIINQAG